MFAPTSRYYGIATAPFTTADGRQIVYVLRRFLPPSGIGTAVVEHVVTQGERLDNIAARFLGDPEQFWRLCDANDVMHPDELTARSGRRLRIPLLQGG